MKKVEQVKALDEILAHLERSSDSLFSGITVQELKREVETARDDINLGKRIEKERIQLLIAPTGSLQDTAIGNGWGDEFSRLANILEQ